ncbi:hypothetical protein [Streptomyces sp. NPDC003247]|uniref:hypothetical protein n=1 Tax=Streptomyces sp. NPDC003247 TaxID=3364677 RepID=UPI0036A78669
MTGGRARCGAAAGALDGPGRASGTSAPRDERARTAAVRRHDVLGTPSDGATLADPAAPLRDQPELRHERRCRKAGSRDAGTEPDVAPPALSVPSAEAPADDGTTGTAHPTAAPTHLARE